MKILLDCNEFVYHDTIMILQQLGVFYKDYDRQVKSEYGYKILEVVLSIDEYNILKKKLGIVK